MFNKKEIKNVKKDYVANTVIVYFSDTELGDFNSIHKSIRANTKFLKIGTNNILGTKVMTKNKFEENFICWTSKFENNNNNIIHAPIFFQDNIIQLKKIFMNADLVIILYNSQNINMLSYVRELSYILNKYDVFSFHCVVENFVTGKEQNKLYQKVRSDATKYSQPVIPILESTIIEAYEDASLVNRKKFISRFVLDLIESIVVPFVEPDLNPNHFTIIKSLFYSNKNNFVNPVIPTIGISSSKVDWLDLSMIQALSNPLFFGSFEASNTFIITIKTPYITNKMLDRIEYILKSVIGEDKKFIISKYVGEFDVEVYSQITILALNADRTKLIEDPEAIDKHVKQILFKVQKSKKLFSDEMTKTLVLETPWDKIKN